MFARQPYRRKHSDVVVARLTSTVGVETRASLRRALPRSTRSAVESDGARCGHALRFPSIPAVPVPHGCRDLAKAGTRKRPTRGANIPANPAMTHSRGAASLLRARERSSEGGPRGPSRLRSRMSDRSCGGSLRQGREVSAWVPGERTRRQCRLVVDLPSVEHYVRVQTEVNLRGVAEPVARLRDRHSATVPQRGAAMAEIVRRECRHPRRLTRPPERCPERVRVEACEHLTVEITVARSRLRDRIEELSRDGTHLPCLVFARGRDTRQRPSRSSTSRQRSASSSPTRIPVASSTSTGRR